MDQRHHRIAPTSVMREFHHGGGQSLLLMFMGREQTRATEGFDITTEEYCSAQQSRLLRSLHESFAIAIWCRRRFVTRTRKIDAHDK
jgi:hypothetical protein